MSIGRVHPSGASKRRKAKEEELKIARLPKITTFIERKDKLQDNASENERDVKEIGEIDKTTSNLLPTDQRNADAKYLSSKSSLTFIFNLFRIQNNS